MSVEGDKLRGPNYLTMKTLLLILLTSLSVFTMSGQTYHMPEENDLHEGTWLQWPHGYTYGNYYRNSLDDTWVSITQSLITSENVHIIAYNNSEKNRIIGLLNNANVSLDKIDFFIHPNDDVWVRDNGPVFVYDENDELVLLDWGFNGWGNDTPYSKCDVIPALIAPEIGVERIDLSAMVLEGGAVEHDGHGTMIATRSSVTHSSRNPNMSEAEIETYLTTYMGFTKFIWLDGLYGDEITDMHIDGVMKLANKDVILTMNNADLLYWGLTQADIDLLYGATNVQGDAFEIVYLPLTQNDVSTENGTNLGYKGSYANYYVGNTVVLVPNYNDANDQVANNIIQTYYPNRTVIGIDVRNLYENGGMIHCVTQQQPVVLTPTSVKEEATIEIEVYPNPAVEQIQLDLSAFSGDKNISIYNIAGQLIHQVQTSDSYPVIPVLNWNEGVYFITMSNDNQQAQSKFTVSK